MIKKYKASSCIGINVVLPSRKSKHIAFMPQSDGSSIYETGNEDEQQALERHRRFGRLFKLVATGSAAMKKCKQEGNTEAVEVGAGTELREVKVSDLASAKDYLAEEFGVSRTVLRTEKAIMEAAKAHGIKLAIDD